MYRIVDEDMYFFFLHVFKCTTLTALIQEQRAKPFKDTLFSVVIKTITTTLDQLVTQKTTTKI